MNKATKHTVEITLPKRTNWSFLQIMSLLLLAFFSILMFMIVAQYIPVSSENNFLAIKQTEVKNIPGYLFVFYLHVFSAGLALPAGFTQFSPFLLKKFTHFHRKMGYLYVIVILFLAAPSGFYIGLFANGGIVAKTSFVTLSVLWFYFTYKGFSYAKNHAFEKHRNYMMLSYALTVSALTLRMWKVIIVWGFHPAPMDTYVVISLLGWIPNYFLATYLIYYKNKKSIPYA